MVLTVGSTGPPGAIEGVPWGPQKEGKSFIFTLIPTISVYTLCGKNI